MLGLKLGVRQRKIGECLHNFNNNSETLLLKSKDNESSTSENLNNTKNDNIFKRIFEKKHFSKETFQNLEGMKEKQKSSTEHMENYNKIGLVYDHNMTFHSGSTYHPECPERLIEVQNKICMKQLDSYCVRIRSRIATEEELTLVHSVQHARDVANLPCLSIFDNTSDEVYDYSNQELKENQDNNCVDESEFYNANSKRAPILSNLAFYESRDMFQNRFTSNAACISAGSLLELSNSVASNQIKNGFALIRPPGHHASSNKVEGFCQLNNVAIASRYIQKHFPLKRILIVDQDVHHGNGTENIFYEDSSVLYISIHRLTPGFYPGTGHIKDVGGKSKSLFQNLEKKNESKNNNGLGMNLNIPQPCSGMGDQEYRLAFKHIVLPVSREFKPDFIFVSAGFDAADGDPLGGMNVSPDCYAQMTEKLMDVCPKLILALEGGYSLESLPNCVCSCLEKLIFYNPETHKNSNSKFSQNNDQNLFNNKEFNNCSFDNIQSSENISHKQLNNNNEMEFSDAKNKEIAIQTLIKVAQVHQSFQKSLSLELGLLQQKLLCISEQMQKQRLDGNNLNNNYQRLPRTASERAVANNLDIDDISPGEYFAGLGEFANRFYSNQNELIDDNITHFDEKYNL